MVALLLMYLLEIGLTANAPNLDPTLFGLTTDMWTLLNRKSMMLKRESREETKPVVLFTIHQFILKLTIVLTKLPQPRFLCIHD